MNVELKNISASFGKVHAVRDVSLLLKPGTTTVLVGPNGAGKSTLLGVLLGLVRPQKGALIVDGHRTDLSKRNTPFSVRRRLGYLPESVAFAESLTGRQVLKFFARARGVPRKRVDQALERVGLAKAGRRAVRGYSRGMRQRLGLAIATINNAELLVLDEPTGGLDQQGLALLWELLQEWRDEGRAAVISSHDLTLIERRADHMVVLSEGRLCAEGSPDELRQQADLPVSIKFILDDDDAAQSLADTLRRTLDGVTVLHDARAVSAQVGPESLLPAMQMVNGQLPHIISTRVEEPGLDEVYERLLQGAP